MMLVVDCSTNPPSTAGKLRLKRVEGARLTLILPARFHPLCSHLVFGAVLVELPRVSGNGPRGGICYNFRLRWEWCARPYDFSLRQAPNQLLRKRLKASVSKTKAALLRDRLIRSFLGEAEDRSIDPQGLENGRLLSADLGV